MLYYHCKELDMDYTEAELEARIFPSVDLDPADWEEHYMTDEQLDEQFDNEPDNIDPWADVICEEE